MKLEALTRAFASVRTLNWFVLFGIVALAFVLGILNNLRVYEEQRVKWFGGPVVETEMEAE